MRFRQLFRETERDVLAYVLRRVAASDDAPDVVAETYLVAWRRIEEVPKGEEARLWLLGVARRQLANMKRGQLRRQRLADRMRDELARLPLDTGAGPERDSDLDEAFASLAEEDREVLTLFAWEGLKPNEIATVLGLRGVTARSRLHRAKKRLRQQLGEGS